MLIIALVLALIGLAALVFAVVTSNALVAWVCIGASALGVLLLIVDAIQERRRQRAGSVASAAGAVEPVTSERVTTERVKIGDGEAEAAADEPTLEVGGAEVESPEAVDEQADGADEVEATEAAGDETAL